METILVRESIDKISIVDPQTNIPVEISTGTINISDTPTLLNIGSGNITVKTVAEFLSVQDNQQTTIPKFTQV